MPDSNPNDPMGLETLKAYLVALEGKPDEALAQLDGKEDPESLLRRLSILNEAERFDEAAALVRGRSPHDRWCEQAVAALAGTGDYEAANRFVEWAHRQSDPLLWPGCLVALARHRYLHTFRDWNKGKPFLPGELDEAHKAGVGQAIEDLAPVVATVKAQRRVLTGIEASAVSLAMEFFHVLGRREEYRELAELVWARKPLPFHYAYAALRKVIPPNPELPKRLREERGESFEAKRLAALIEGTLLGKAKAAVEVAEQLVSQYQSPDQQQQLAHLLIQLAQHLPADDSRRIQERAEALLGPDSRYAKFRAIESLIKEGNFAAAEERLEQTPDDNDANWLECLATVRLGQNRPQEAVELLIRGTERFPETELLRKAAVVAGREGRTAESVRLTERLLRADPDDAAACGHLAQLRLKRGEYDKAAEQFHKFRQLRPTDPAAGVNEAVSLALALRYDESLRVYEEMCSLEQPPIQAILGRAVLLKTMNRTEEGFKSLERHRSTFWDHADFLKVYVDLSYAAKREREAGQGFLRLHELQMRGSIEEVLHAVSVAELLEMHRRFAENEEMLNLKVLQGQFPWLLVGQLSRMPFVAAFRERTRSLRWADDDPAAWAQHTLYGTNGYVVTAPEGGRRWLEPIGAPQKGQKIAIDLTSLIVLHRLGLLSLAADFFGECHYPSEYRAVALRDQNRLIIHQPSRLEAEQAIKATIDKRDILILAPGQTLPFVHEHSPGTGEETGHIYGLRDLLPALEQGQFLSDEKSSELARLARRPSGVDENHQPLRLGDRVHFDTSSLETLQQHGLLGATLSAFGVHVSEADRIRIDGQIAEWTERQLLSEWHSGLWDAVKADPRFLPAAHGLPAEFVEASSDREEGDGQEHPWLSLYSAFLADEMSLPLLVDDRCCQMLVHNGRRSATAAFGTDSLLAALLESQLMTPGAAAEAYLRLVEWRYRFLIVPVEVLVTLAKQNLKSPPGQPLRQVARYVQDSMRDQGLFGGKEQTQPPIAMAHKLFLDWHTVITDFVFTVWDEEGVPQEAARTLTEWALTECLPSPPLSARPDERLLAERQARVVLSQALIRSATRRHVDRANAALVTICNTLGISDREYLEEIAEVANAF